MIDTSGLTNNDAARVHRQFLSDTTPWRFDEVMTIDSGVSQIERHGANKRKDGWSRRGAPFRSNIVHGGGD
jgi:hypothetical protein